jgi:primosomal protein DnaI
MKKLKDMVEPTVLYDDIKQEVLANKEIRDFLDKHQLSDKAVDENLTSLYRYVNEARLPGVSNLTLVLKGDRVMVEYEVVESKPPKRLAFIASSMHDEFEQTEERIAITDYIIDYIQRSEFMRGVYIYGKPGVGKTRILSVVRAKLEKHEKVYHINYPEFVRDIKQSIQDQTVEEKMKILQTVDTLLLDDFGDEGIGNAWYRDEILLPLLQVRVSNKRPIMIASNYSPAELAEAMNRSVNDPVKVERIMERIRVLTRTFELKGKNYRIDSST